MAKKPRLTLVDLTSKTPPPPSTLGKSGAKLWEAIQSEYRIADSGGRALLLQACTAIDRADECSETIDREGMMIRTSNGGRREHPLLRLELANRAFAMKSLHRLGLDIEPPRPGPGRPPGSMNPTRA
jgi:P27 family predicted phage terminase small subunit